MNEDQKREWEEEPARQQEQDEREIDLSDYEDDGQETPASRYKERTKGPGVKMLLVALAVILAAVGAAGFGRLFSGSTPLGEQGIVDPSSGTQEEGTVDGDQSGTQGNPLQGNGKQEDNRSNLEKLADPKDEYSNYLLCGVDNTELLTDVILVASLHKKDGTVTLLQIPRDSYIGDGYQTGKINEIYSHNPSGEKDMAYLVEAIEQRLWIPIDNYAVVDLKTVREVVDAMGGVPVTLPRDIYYKSDKVLYAGEQVLDGERAEWMIRYRKGYTTGDIGRLDMQKVFLKAFAQHAKSLGILKLGGLAKQFYPKIENNMSLGDIVSLIPSAMNIEMDKVEIVTVPGYGVMHNTYAVYGIDKEATAELLNEYFWHGEIPLTAEDLDFPEPNGVTAAGPVEPEQEIPQEETEQIQEPQEEKPSGGKLQLISPTRQKEDQEPPSEQEDASEGSEETEDPEEEQREKPTLILRK